MLIGRAIRYFLLRARTAPFDHQKRSAKGATHLNNRGFTLVEMVSVVLLVAILGSLSYQRFDKIVIWRMRGEVRKLVSTWELLYQESMHRSESYRLIIDLDNQSYFVRREIAPEPGTIVRNVDYLKNLRTKGEKKRRQERQKDEELGSLEEEFAAEESRQGQGLEGLFYQSIFIDPSGDLKLTQPLEFPSLAQETELSEGIKIINVVTDSGEYNEGQVPIRFSSRGGSDFAVLHIEINETPMTVLLNPWTGQAITKKEYVDYNWLLGK